MISALPQYRRAIDWDEFDATYPQPDVFAETTFKQSPEQLRALQEKRFADLMVAGWENPFYRRRWTEAGLEPGDVRSLADIGMIPTYTTADIAADQEAHPPFGSNAGVSSVQDLISSTPTKVQSSGGTTGKPRLGLSGPVEWEMGALSTARGLYVQGARPGDIMQIPATCSLANLGWGFYSACHYYLGILPITTGSGVVMPTRKQLETAFACGVNTWMSFPEYLLRLARGCREELNRDVRELNTKMIATFLGPDLDGALRAELEELWGCPVYDYYGTNEVGLGAFECQHQTGLHLQEDLNFFEVLDTETEEPVADGEPGNLVVTSFHRRIQPVIRFNLRDLGRIVSTEQCGCGSNFRRMDHMLGRSDNMVRIRGVNVYPMACLSAVRSDPRTAGEWICEASVGDRNGQAYESLVVHVEVLKDAGSVDGLREGLEARLKADLGLSVAVDLVEEGALTSLAHMGEGKASRLIDNRKR